MKTIVAIMFVLLSAQSLQAQVRHSTYRIRLELLNGHSRTGYLQHMSDSTIRITKNLRRKGGDTTLYTSRIKSIGLRRQKPPVEGIVLGGMLGAIVGGVIGYGTSEDCIVSYLVAGPGSGEALGAAGGAAIGFLLGATLGSLAGTSYRMFEINGDAAAFKEFRTKQGF